MIEVFIYWLLNLLGYRKFHYDFAFSIGISLDSFEAWRWRPKYQKGTYREIRSGWTYCGYGVEK